MSKFVVLSLVFSFSLIADTLSLRYSPKNFDYIFSANPNSISQVPIVADFLIKKYEEQAKSNWCKELGIDIENMSSFSFTANLNKFIRLKVIPTDITNLQNN